MVEGKKPLLQAGSSTSTSSLLPMTSNRGESSTDAGSSSGCGHAKHHPVFQGTAALSHSTRGCVLYHIAALPENASMTPSVACCHAFSVILDGAGGGAACLCHLVRKPSFLGSLVNASGLSSLFSSCGKSAGVVSPTFVAKIPSEKLRRSSRHSKPPPP